MASATTAVPANTQDRPGGTSTSQAVGAKKRSTTPVNKVSADVAGKSVSTSTGKESKTGNVFSSLPVLFFVWYASSVFCTTISKILVRDVFPSAYWLTFAQFCVAAVVGYVVVRIVDGTAPVKIPFLTEMWREFMALAGVFAFGMVALNKGYENMHVSLVETLRATEPVVSAAFTSILLPAEMPSAVQCACLVPIVLGACMSSYGSSDFNVTGLVWVLASNVCFCLRTIQYKQASRKYKVSDFQLFFHICRLGILFQFLFGVIGDPAGLRTCVGSLANAATSNMFSLDKLKLLTMIVLNGIFYYTYLQFSWVILMRVPVVTHAVGNCMRRPVVLVCNVLYFQNPVTLINAAGILCAFVGVLLYTSIKSLLGLPKTEPKKQSD